MKTTKTQEYFRHKNMYGVIKKGKDFYLLFTVTGVSLGRIARTSESDLAFEKKDWQFFSTQRLEELEAQWVFRASKKIYWELKKVYGELKKESPLRPEAYFDLETFKRFLQLPPTFQKYENIRRYILHPAIRAINRDMDLDLWVNEWIREKKKKKQAPQPVIGFFLNFNMKPSQKKKIQK